MRESDTQTPLPTNGEKLDYWRRTLSSPPPVGILPDQSRPPISSFFRENEVLVLHETTQSRLADISHKTGVSIGTILCSALTALLARHTGQSDIILGSIFAWADQSGSRQTLHTTDRLYREILRLKNCSVAWTRPSTMHGFMETSLSQRS